MKVFIVTHKIFNLPKLDDIYVPIQVGAELKKVINESWLQDNIGSDNISKKNGSYNELTGLYWMWRNANDNIIGLCHYRRYFVGIKGKIMNFLLGHQTDFINEKYINKALKKHDLIVHNKTIFSEGNKKQYLNTQKFPNDIELLGEILEKKYPEYVNAYNQVMEGKTCHLLNMMIGKKEVIDKYCEWLFSVLFDVERELITRGEERFERRMGMLGERMLDIWIIANNVRVKETFCINTERIERSIR